MHAIVEAEPLGQEKAVDLNILTSSNDGIYSTTSHLAQLKQAGDGDPLDPAGYAGLKDGVDWHWDRILARAALSTH